MSTAPKARKHVASKLASAVPDEDAALEALEQRLGYRFAQPKLLQLAVTHSSYIYEGRLGRARSNGDEPNEPGTDNEQLEFLGDAVLGLTMTELLLETFPERSEGELTRIRSSLVSRKRMAAMGEALELHAVLRLGRSAELAESRQKTAVLANAAEAVLGAMHMDRLMAERKRGSGTTPGRDAIRALLQNLLLGPDLPAIRAALDAAPGRGALRDAKSRLQERVQAVGAGRLVYVDTGESGPAHARHFSVEVCLQDPEGCQRALAGGAGGSKKEAQQAAAELALASWPPDETDVGNGAGKASGTVQEDRARRGRA